MASRPPLRTASTSSSYSTDSPTAAAAAPPGGVPQSITSLLNNPLPSASAGSYWLPWPPPAALPDAPPPPSHPCEVSRADFAPYLARVADPFARFADVRLHATAELALAASDHAAPAPTASASSPSSSSGLAACLREVPALFFKEDFALEEGATFEAACPLADAALQERLGQHLDVVEAHLVREIARRSESFYEAQGRLRGLDGEIVAAVGRIRELREVVRVLTGDLVGDAQQVQELNADMSHNLNSQRSFAPRPPEAARAEIRTHTTGSHPIQQSRGITRPKDISGGAFRNSSVARSRMTSIKQITAFT